MNERLFLEEHMHTSTNRSFLFLHQFLFLYVKYIISAAPNVYNIYSYTSIYILLPFKQTIKILMDKIKPYPTLFLNKYYVTLGNMAYYRS